MKLLVTVLLVLLLTARAAHAGPPLITDDAGTVAVGSVEMELNGSVTHDKENTNGVSLRHDVSDGEAKLTTGLSSHLGMSLSLPYTFSERTSEDGNLVGTSEGFGDLTVELKYGFAEWSGIAFAIKPAITVPTGNYRAGLSEGRWQFGGTLITTKEFDEGTYALHANVGYGHHDYRTVEARTCNRSDIWFGSVAGEATVFSSLTVVAEVGLSTTQDSSTAELTGFALGGVRFALNEYLDVDAGIKLGITKPEDDVSLRYGIVVKY